ncbi:MAG: 30S ribosomal protein S2, partial [Caldithrix sp.]|nr:30S ribosomal protein S2 [Caldithrix sp.]
GTYEKITKKERLVIDREKEKLFSVLGGIEEMKRLPGIVFIVDTNKEHIAVKEARKMNIPVVAMVDTNSDPTLIDYPIPANDDAAKSISLMTSIIADTVNEARQKADEQKALEEAAKSEKESAAKEQEAKKAKAKPKAKTQSKTKSKKEEKPSEPAEKQKKSVKAPKDESEEKEKTA